eukprot:TRINITY_DN114_c1_g1_i1.p1 TRINITY_DN114_c1_g1~~TRINITY_DN114_c1_g1_i1.p1  ORF type:complete len:90 (+),score=2.40 TRINITY_DN114_c1_g1_i1:269-538(+)
MASFRIWIRNLAKVTKSTASHENEFVNTNHCFQSTTIDPKKCSWQGTEILLLIFCKVILYIMKKLSFSRIFSVMSNTKKIGNTNFLKLL